MTAFPKDLYHQAHLFAAAVRVLTHQQSTPPDAADLSRCLAISPERALRICNRLVDLAVIVPISGAYADRFSVGDPSAIEAIPRDETESDLDAEVRKFKAERQGLAEKVEAIKAEQEKKQKALFAAIEQQFKSKKQHRNGGD